MPSVKTARFYWAFGIWAGAVILGTLMPAVPPSGPPPGQVAWLWVGWLASAVGSLALWPRVWRVHSRPVLFRAAEGSVPEPLRTAGVGPAMLGATLACSIGVLILLVGLPLSPSLQLAAGLRERRIEFPLSPPALEDFRLADIYLLPLNSFPEGAAAALAAQLRQETGLAIAALPRHEVRGMEIDPQRKQVVIECLPELLRARVEKIQLPPPPRPHPPLVVLILPEDAYSRLTDWRFILSNSFNASVAIICTHRLHYDLPADDRQAQRRLAERAKKLILRLIAFHCFDAPRTSDPRSLTGVTLRGIRDLDEREGSIRIPRNVKPGGGPGL